MKKRHEILIVDDEPFNVKLLSKTLEKAGMNILSAYNGRDCLEKVNGESPDLILLDIMMPDMDGLEVCRKLKENDQSRFIPVIFLTAKTSKKEILEGLDAGAVDYITKPIDLQETLARVQTQLRMVEMHRRNLDLRDRLANSRQAAAVGAITQGISHNLNNLLGIIVGYLDLLKNSIDNPEVVKRSTDLIDKSVDRMVALVRKLSLISTAQNALSDLHSLSSLLENSVERFRLEHNIMDEVFIDNPLGDLEIRANAEVFEGIIEKLLINAWESYPENAETRKIDIITEIHNNNESPNLLIKVKDEGCGIDETVGEHIFEPFISTKDAVGRGMGLTIARHSIRNVHGELRLKPLPRGGTVAELSFPL